MNAARHGYSSDICDRLERISWGARASEILDSRAKVANCTIATLPMFVWDHPSRDAGRKATSLDGDLLMPTRISWNTPSSVLLIDPSETFKASWKTPKGSTSSPSRGATEFTVVHDVAEATLLEQPLTSIPRALAAPIQRRMEARRTLIDLAKDGRNARWEILHIFEENLEWNFTRALASVKTEMRLSGNVLDRAASESLQNKILFGDGSSDKSEPESLAFALIDRCLTKETFAKVDPGLYIRRWMFSTSESAIRRYIGDPHIGRKIRKVAQEIDANDERRVIEEFSRRYPKGHLGARRVKDALSAPQRVAQGSQAFTFGDLTDANTKRGAV